MWLGTNLIQDWIASQRHAGAANYLYLDGHAATMMWQDAGVDMYPDSMVLLADSTYTH